MERNPNVVWSHISKPMVASYVILALALALCVGLEIGKHQTYLGLKPFLVGFGGLYFLGVSIVAVRRCASCGPKSIGQVCFWSAVLLGFAIFLMYWTYFLAFPSAPANHGAESAVSKLLNIPPVIAAVWAASIGWYVHFQATAKAHRTNNAFNLLMQTRTSKEFLDRSELIQRYFPHGSEIVAVDVNPDRSDDRLYLKQLEAELAAAEARQWPKAPHEEIALLVDRIGRVKAQLALRYMLNFYEVMAVAIAKNDLDDSLLFDTLGTLVPSLYRRAEMIATYERGKGKDGVLVFTALKPLVERWERQNEVERRKLEDQSRIS